MLIRHDVKYTKFHVTVISRVWHELISTADQHKIRVDNQRNVITSIYEWIQDI